MQTPLTDSSGKEKIVLHITTESGWRGGENQIRFLVDGMATIGWRSILVCPQDSALGSWAKHSQVQQFTWNARNDLDLFAAWRLLKIIRQIKPAIIATHSSRAHGMAVFAKTLGAPGALHVYRRTNFLIRKTLANRWKFESPHIKTFIAISDAIGASLKSFGVQEERIRIIKSAIDPTPFQQLSRENCRGALTSQLGISASSILLGFAGQIETSKGVDILVDSFTNAPLLQTCHLLIAGRGALLESLRDKVKNSHKRANIHFLGFLHDTAPFMKSLDIFCLPSLEEGLGTVLLEAIASSVFCCASRVGGIPELIQDGKSGLLFEPLSIDDLKNVLVRACSEPDFRSSCVCESAKILENHQVTTLMRKTNQTYAKSL